MKAFMRKSLGVKGSSINASSPQAEREITLSNIDSMLWDYEIDYPKAREMVITWAVNTDNTVLLPTILATMKER